MPFQSPEKDRYDVVIVGGAIMGSAAAWFLSDSDSFDGSVLVVDRDMSFAQTATAHSTSCIRQQFSTDLNVRISQFGADFVKNMRSYMGGDARVPELTIRSFGYMYLADTEAFAEDLRERHAVQVAAGAATRLMSREEIAEAYPFYALDDIVLGSINTVDEGYYDSMAVFEWMRRQARDRGVSYLENEVMDISVVDNRVASVTLATGEVIACGHVVNASGPRAARTAAMAGVALPVEPRKRYSWIFTAETPLDRDLPLTIDPSGLHVRENGGGTYQAGGHFGADDAVDFDDFAMDHALWENEAWPLLATRIPQFEAVKLTHSWAGHYEMNTVDYNAIIGPHPEIGNLLFLNGFSGHGLQQAPAMGRGIAEWLSFGAYRSLDLSAFHFDRLQNDTARVELAVI
ncbi:FAD-binding oxidoreductase [Marivita sp. S6314]|uniref:NAD(P)/FAD-dependent oxidoreductase n=1 Tax=Marivita sp. S6314 TaxID=2926406 RepID=UPI001FF2F64D|nr:FAD-binding oxidoreductase [Marivita sp. S6314]MCK0150800.1 FAD-binding oxidoreductase [Marivita sp. S6314]